MSINTFHSKVEVSSKQQQLRYLTNPEGVKKELENERRLARLKQVREKSKNVAQTIRQEVAAEKKRQIQTLENTKQQELNTWREHVMAKKYQDYRTSVFQVGAAHRAAQVETEKNEKQKQLREQKMKNCQRLAAKNSTKPKRANLLRITGGGTNLNAGGRATAGTQTPAQAENAINGKENRLCHKQTCKPTNCINNYNKRKQGTHCPTNLNDQEDSNDEDACQILLESSDEECAAPCNRKMDKTPPIILDVDDDSDDSLNIGGNKGIEINDRHMQTNRQFSRVVRPTNTKGSELQREAEVEAIPARPRFTQISELVQRNKRPPQVTHDTADRRQEEQQTHTPRSPTRSSPRSPQKAQGSPIRTATAASSKQAKPDNRRQNIPPAKVVDAGIKRSSVTVPSKSNISKSAQESAKQEQQTHTPRSPTRSSPRSPQKAKPTEVQNGSSQGSPIKTATAAAASSKPAKPDNRRQNIPPAKVVDAGIKRSSVNVPSKSNISKSAQESAKQKSKIQQPSMGQPPAEPTRMEQKPQQEPLIQQQHPMQQPVLPHPPYVHPLMQPHVMYAPQMMQAYPMLPYPMPPYPMQPMGQFAPQPPAPATQQQGMQPASTITTTSTGAPTRTTASHTTVSTTTVMMRAGQGTAENTTSGRVQFYDHNNKYQRNYNAPTEAVHVNLPDNTNMNAMEQARIETNMRNLREQELESRRQVTEQRGQQALQREQVRRDCAELTEKLDALSLQQPQLLPSDANFVPSHRFADLASKREQKMNAAMEEMLLRPAIVTCPEIRVDRHPSPKKSSTRCASISPDAINLGNPPVEISDTASACSKLLDFVDDQSNQLRTELKGMQSNCTKSMKLRSLLQRIEKIRARLLAELQAGDMDGDYAQKVIDSIRNERANLHTNIDQREMELQQKEELMEQRLRKMYKQQQKVNGRKQQSSDNPVEIIIKVKSDGTVKQYVPKMKAQDKQKPEDNSPPTATIFSADAEEAPQAASSNQRQNSIESTSTVYRELPPVNYQNIRPAPAAPDSTPAQQEPLDPMVAHYVQRLLGMSRHSIEKLSVSSSDVPTPSESIINQPRNMSNRIAIDNRRVEQAQAVIQDNRSFVVELEDTLRNQEQQQQQQQQQKQRPPPDESSQLAFEQMWNQRLANKMQQQQQQEKQLQRLKQKQQKEAERPAKSTKANAAKQSVATASRSVAYQLSQELKNKREATATSGNTQIQRRSTETIRQRSRIIFDCKESEDKYHEKCRQRIAKLEALIDKVRREKNQLVEVTLTSASEGERHSTEYFDLPPGQRQQQLQQPGSRTLSERTDSHNTSPSHSEALPLQKNKPTGASLDSGISISRPVTAMGQEPVEAEPTSLASSTQSGAAQRRGKVPPATIRRYSPQLAADELAHELSTITEVDTPAQSHMMAATTAPVPFPSFEQYAQELDIDFERMDENQSMRIQQEFHELIKIIKQLGTANDYREFPSITAYLHNVSTTTTRIQVESGVEQPSYAVIHEMQLPDVSVREFPNRREFIQQLLAREPPEQRDLIDSASLDSSDSFNVEAELRQRRLLRSSFRREPEAEIEVASSTRRESIPANNNGQAPDESGIEPLSRSRLTIDVQLDRHRMRPPKQQQHSTFGSQSPAKDRSTGGGLEIAKYVPQEDKPVSRSQSPQKNNSDAVILHNSEDNIQNVSDMAGALNLRNWLTDELARRKKALAKANNSSESSDSLKDSFLQSIIDSLTPSGSSPTPALGHATNGTNDRQKTSTPVGSVMSDQDRCGSVHSGSSQLFSGESSLSAVHYADGTPPIPYERQTISLGRNSRTPNEQSRRAQRR